MIRHASKAFSLWRFSSISSFEECKRYATDIKPRLKLSVLCASMETEKEPIFVDLERMIDCVTDEISTNKSPDFNFLIE